MDIAPLLSIIILLLLGFVLLAIEMFVVPGFGIFGILGLGSLLGGAAAAYYTLGEVWGFLVLGLSLVVVVVVVKIMSRAGLGKAFILKEFSGVDTDAPGAITGGEQPPPVGSEGVAVTSLRPSGVVEVAGERYDAITDGDFIDIGSRIRLVRVHGFQVVVESFLQQSEREIPPGND